MTDALTSLDMSTGLRKVAERAKREPAARFHSLAHLIDEELLAGVYRRLRGDAAVGVDGITKEGAADKAVIQRVKVPPHQSLDLGA
jgi:hypothetical protein